MKPLSVRINDGAGNDKHVRYRSLSFRKSAFGGWVSLNITVQAGPNDFTDLGPNDRIYVYETRTGAVVWEGYCDNPGVTKGPRGEVYEITALGGSKWASSLSSPYWAVDRRLSIWERSGYSTNDADTSQEANTDGVVTVLSNRAAAGLAVGTDWQGVWVATLPEGYSLSRIGFTTVSGITDANYVLLAYTENLGTPGFTTRITQSASTTPTTYAAAFGSTTDERVYLQVGRDTSGTTATNAHWFDLYDPVLRATMKNLDGTDRTSGYLANEVYAHEVITDLIGRGLLQLVDPSWVSIFTGTSPIDQLTAEDGITGSSLLDILSLHEDFWWGYYDTNAAGQHRATFSTWDDTARYEISVRDGYTQPGSEADLCNHVLVGYTEYGKAKTLHAFTPGATPPWIDAEAITIPEGFGGADVAAAVGARVLAARSMPAVSARALVRRPIMDLYLGRMVMPWEIEPGYTVRVREPGYELRLSEADYDDDSRSCALTLGVPIVTPDELLASLTRKSAGPGTKQVAVSQWSKDVRQSANTLTAVQGGGWVTTLSGPRGN